MGAGGRAVQLQTPVGRARGGHVKELLPHPPPARPSLPSTAKPTLLHGAGEEHMMMGCRRRLVPPPPPLPPPCLFRCMQSADEGAHKAQEEQPKLKIAWQYEKYIQDEQPSGRAGAGGAAPSSSSSSASTTQRLVGPTVGGCGSCEEAVDS